MDASRNAALEREKEEARMDLLSSQNVKARD